MLYSDALKMYGGYQGSQHKPDDFDDFWDNAKKEVENLPTDYELVKKDFSSDEVECYDLTFKGVGGAKIYCQLAKPVKFVKKTYPASIQFHGYHSSIGDWSERIASAAQGTLAVAMDVRGQGGKSEDTTDTIGGTLKGHIIRGVEDGPEKLFYRSVFQDTYQLAKIIFNMDEVDKENVSVSGASQGGALAMVCAALEPRVSYAYLQYPFLSDYREAYRLDVLNSAYEELAYWFRFRDPLHKKEKEFFDTLDYIDIQYLAPRVKAEVIWGIGLEDNVCRPKTQFAVFNQLDTKKKMIPYPEYGHEYLPEFGDEIRKIMSGGSSRN